MNAIFIFSFCISALILTIKDADKLVLAMQNGATSAVELSISLLALYAVWLGIFEIMEKSGITQKLSKFLKRPLRALFGDMKNAESATCVSVTANFLGLSGVATPLAINACTEFDRDNNEYAKSMLFVLSATSIQLLPTSVIALRASHGSAFPSSIILPSLISTLFSTVLGIILVKIFIKK